MGKYFVMYVFPAMVVLPTIWWGVRTWYVKRFGRHVKRQQEINNATNKYERMLKKGNKK